MTNVAADDDDQKSKKEKKAATLASFICILQWARDSLRVGKISKSASLTAMRHFGLPSWAQSWAWRWDGDGDEVGVDESLRRRVAMVIDVASESNCRSNPTGSICCYPLSAPGSLD